MSTKKKETPATRIENALEEVESYLEYMRGHWLSARDAFKNYELVRAQEQLMQVAKWSNAIVEEVTKAQ